MTLTTDPNDPRLREILPNGQQAAYIVLSEEERAKGWVRPLRRAYIHVGPDRPANLRPLSDNERHRFDRFGYVRFEAYEDDPDSSVTGRFWTQEDLDRIGGCQGVTTMGLALCETYCRDPDFYGATYCSTCRRHYPVKEFRWVEDGEVVGS